MLFRRRKATAYNLRDITDLVFLHCVALHILRQEYETAPWAWRYAARTVTHGDFHAMDAGNTDLYQGLWVLANHEMMIHGHLPDEADDLLWHAMSWHTQTAARFLHNMASRRYDTQQQRQLLLSMERQLNITTTNYRSVRRLSVEWDTGRIDTEAKQLTITRLLQALRAKARGGEILPQLELLSKLKRYELINVCDPETGRGCDDPKADKTAAAPAVIARPTMSFLKKLATAAAIGAGAVLLSKSLRHKE